MEDEIFETTIENDEIDPIETDDFDETATEEESGFSKLKPYATAAAAGVAAGVIWSKAGKPIARWTKNKVANFKEAMKAKKLKKLKTESEKLVSRIQELEGEPDVEEPAEEA